MNKFLAIIIFFAFAFAQAQSAKQFCSDGMAPYTGKGEGKNDAEARAKANESIAMQVSSSVQVKSNITRNQREIDGIAEDENTFSETVTIESVLENAGSIKDVAKPKLINGQYEVERYMCRSDAAKPYLASLKALTAKLKNFRGKTDEGNCKEISEIYGEIKKNEGRSRDIWKVDVALKKSYDSLYAEINKKCNKIGKGIFLRITPKTSELSKEFAKVLKIPFKTEGECLQGVEIWPKAEDVGCSKNSFTGFICAINVSLEIKECGSGKELPPLNGKITGSGKPSDAEAKMRRNFRECDFPDFDKWKKELQPWMEQ